MAVLHVFRNSERDAAGGSVAQKWQFQCDVIIEQPLGSKRILSVLKAPQFGELTCCESTHRM